LNSGWQLSVPVSCMAVLGLVSNVRHKKDNLGKAGKSFALGFRPKVRGVAKNPCDHPHGGGNGKKSKPVNPVTAWGHFTVGTPTKNKKFERKRRRLFKKL